jgi:hypothetical protein
MRLFLMGRSLAQSQYGPFDDQAKRLYAAAKTGQSYAPTKSALAPRRTPRARCGPARLEVRLLFFSISLFFVFDSFFLFCFFFVLKFLKC